MNYKVLSLKETDQWKSFLKQMPDDQQDIYYTPDYYSLYQNMGDGNAQCFVFEKNGEIALYPFLINSVNDLGYCLDRNYFDIQGAYGYNGIITSTYNEDFKYAFYKTFSEYVNDSAIIAEFTRFHPLLKNKAFSQANCDIVFDRHTVYLDIKKPVDEIFRSFQRTTRKQINRGKNKFNIEVRIYNSKCDIDEFYSVYRETMDRIGSVDYLYFSREYFKELVAKVPSIITSAYIEDQLIASIIWIKGKHIFHGHLGGAKTKYLHYSLYSILYYEGLLQAKREGMQMIHFGGGATNDPNDNLLKYKLHFSKTKADFFIGKKVHNDQIYNKVVSEWNSRFPEKTEKYKNFLLKYRY